MRITSILALSILLCSACSPGIIATVPPSSSTRRPSTTPSLPPSLTMIVTPAPNITQTADWAQFQVTLSALNTHVAEIAIQAAPTALPSMTPTAGHPTDTPQQISTEQAAASNAAQAAELKETQTASFSPDCDAIDFTYSLISPTGNWLALSCGLKINQTLQIYSKIGKKWVLQFKDYVAKQFLTDGQPPMGNLLPVRWTKDETYLYFASGIDFSGGGTCFYGGDGQGLYRLNIRNGDVGATLSPIIGPDEYIFSFSPSGRWLAVTAGVPTIIDLQTGEETILPEGSNRVGDFTWSPDSSKLAYSTCRFSEDYDTIKKSAIRVFSLKTHESKTILETDAENVFLRIKSGDNNQLIIYDSRSDHPTYHYFDWSSDQINSPALIPW